jgi:hypothetical protein
VASQVLRAWGGLLALSNDIPARQPAAEPRQMPVNEAERILREMFDRAGLDGYEPQTPIELGRPLGTTVPDFFFGDPEGEEPGVCVYLDGMSEHLHGNPETAERDRHIREQLRSMGYQVIEIPFGQMTDRQAMRGHFYRIGRFLLGRDDATRIREDLSWFDTPPPAPADSWDELENLVDRTWAALAAALRVAGAPPPSDVDRDIVEGGRVTGRRMALVWDERGGFFAIVDKLANDTLAGDSRYVLVDHDAPVSDTVHTILAHFSGLSQPPGGSQ